MFDSSGDCVVFGKKCPKVGNVIANVVCGKLDKKLF